MKSAKLTAIIYAVVLSLLLLIPTLTIRFVDHDARKDWENRALSVRPTMVEVLDNPKQGFKDFDEYLNDHIGGSFQTIKFRRKFYFDVFNATGDKYIVGKNDGALFLTSPFQHTDRENPFSWWNDLCVNGQDERYQKAYARRLVRSFEYLSTSNAKIVYGMVPTTPVLLQDQLPRSTPQHIKAACELISKDNNMATVLKDITPNVEIFYPYEAFKSRVADPLFYPNAAYHWQGESTWIFTEELARLYDLDVSPKWDSGPCTASDVKWDIGSLVGVGQDTKGCDRDLAALEIDVDEKFMYPLNAGSRKNAIQVVKMTNPHAINDKSAIVFSNSFGPAVREQVASHFKTTYHLRGGIISAPDMQNLLENSDILGVDFIIVTIADFHYPGFLSFIEPSKQVLEGEARDYRAATEAERLALKEAQRKEREKLRAEIVAKKEAAIAKKRAARARIKALQEERKAEKERKKLALEAEGKE